MTRRESGAIATSSASSARACYETHEATARRMCGSPLPLEHYRLSPEYREELICKGALKVAAVGSDVPRVIAKPVVPLPPVEVVSVASNHAGRKPKTYPVAVLDHVAQMANDGARLFAIARFLKCSTTTAHKVRLIALGRKQSPAERRGSAQSVIVESCLAAPTHTAVAGDLGAGHGSASMDGSAETTTAANATGNTNKHTSA